MAESESIRDRRRARREYPGSPDCGSCALREGCENAEEGKFCARFRSEAAPDRGKSPAERWAEGDEISL